MTNPTVAAVMGHVTLTIDGINNCDAEVPPKTSSYGWGLYKDSDAVSLATFTRPFSEGSSNEWMHHRTGFLSLSGRVICSDGAIFAYDLGDLPFRRYELNLRRYKRRLDSQRDSLIFAVENAGTPFGSADIAVSAYFRILLLE